MSDKTLFLNVPVTNSVGEPLNSPDAKKIRRLAVKNALSDNKVRVQYVRSDPYHQIHNSYDHEGNIIDVVETVSKGDPYGVVVSEVVNGRLYIGWSLLHTKDAGKYDRDFGILQALQRLAPFELYLNNNKVPDDIRKTMARLVARNILYFRGKS